MLIWWARRDSNPQPRDYESPALTVELQALPLLSVICGLRFSTLGLLCLKTQVSITFHPLQCLSIELLKPAACPLDVSLAGCTFRWEIVTLECPASLIIVNALVHAPPRRVRHAWRK